MHSWELKLRWADFIIRNFTSWATLNLHQLPSLVKKHTYFIFSSTSKALDQQATNFKLGGCWVPSFSKKRMLSSCSYMYVFLLFEKLYVCNFLYLYNNEAQTVCLSQKITRPWRSPLGCRGAQPNRNSRQVKSRPAAWPDVQLGQLVWPREQPTNPHVRQMRARSAWCHQSTKFFGWKRTAPRLNKPTNCRY